MRLAAVSHWSFGRERSLVRQFRDSVDRAEIQLHDLRADIDLNRTSLAISGDSEAVVRTIEELADEVFPSISLARHIGAHSRTGALDECSFIVPSDRPDTSETELAHGAAESLAARLAAKHSLPVYLQDKTGRHADAELAALREGGYALLMERELSPDFGPARAHEHLGVSLVGVRDYWITLESRFAGTDLSAVRGIAADVPLKRASGDERLLGVEAEAYRLASLEECCLFLHLTLPDLTAIDPIVAWVIEEASIVQVGYRSTEIVGLIRRKDVASADRARFREAQVAW